MTRPLSTHITCVNCFSTVSNSELHRASQWTLMLFWKKQRYVLLSWIPCTFWHTTFSKAFGCRAQGSSHLKPVLGLIFRSALICIWITTHIASCSIVISKPLHPSLPPIFISRPAYESPFLSPLHLCFRSCGLTSVNEEILLCRCYVTTWFSCPSIGFSLSVGSLRFFFRFLRLFFFIALCYAFHLIQSSVFLQTVPWILYIKYSG